MNNSVTNKNEYDNGGAIAIKGFNFQHAVAALIIICNYEKENFSIILIIIFLFKLKVID